MKFYKLNAKVKRSNSAYSGLRKKSKSGFYLHKPELINKYNYYGYVIDEQRRLRRLLTPAEKRALFKKVSDSSFIF